MAALPDVEIEAGVGVAGVRVGQSRAAVEEHIGPPVHPGKHSRAVYDVIAPLLVVTYDRSDTVEIVETGYSGSNGGEEVYFDGVQLTYRFIDEVVADLVARGLHAHPTDIGFWFDPGFAIFSMASLSAKELDPDTPEHTERPIVEGVGVAPASYFAYGDEIADMSPGDLQALRRHLHDR